MTEAERKAKFENEISRISKVNFDALHNLFKANNWKWGALHRDGKWVCDVPLAHEIEKVFYELIGNLRELISKNGFPKAETGCSTGRLEINTDSEGYCEFKIHIDSH